ncbi:MAG: phosphomannomutase/phosphoglucomutase [Lachnospiraceae bacterium]|nr:phosphomannomutase/phosphoglucomutase [Lachnospiraceae bacterium]
MKKKSLLKLQNGSDIRGVAMSGVKGEDVTLTGDVAQRIGVVFASMIAERTGMKASDLKIAVGRDSRLSGEQLLISFSSGVATTGAKVIDCGLTSTPAMFMATVYDKTACDASCMVTASHLPFNRNGFKFFTKEGGFEKADITELLTRVQDMPAATSARFDLTSLYAAHLSEIIKAGVGAEVYEHPLEGLKILVDAGNGNGGFFAYKVLAPLGADITGSQFLDPDGSFPNHVPNPEDNKAMRAVCDATLAHEADLGLIFDTDVDRMSAVFADGTPVSRDACIALVAAILAPDHPGATIVTDSVTSDRLTAFLEDSLRLKHDCFKRGYKNVINRCIELNEQGIDCPLAMETSGHGCLKENHYLDDGAYLAVKIVIALALAKREGKDLADLIKDFSMRFSAREVRLHILEKNDFASYGEEVLGAFREQAKANGYDLQDSHEGIRVRFAKGSLSDSFEGGWLILRSSLHDPVMVLNMEGHTDADLFQITLAAKKMLTSFWKLDISSL